MSNLSDAKGKWIVPTEFIKSNRKLFYRAIDEINANKVFGFNWLDEFFDQGEVNNKTVKEIEIPFCGTGRWSFDKTCKYLLRPGYYPEESYPNWNELMKLIRRKSVKTRIYFKDIEPGVGFFYEQSGVFNGSEYMVQKDNEFNFDLKTIISGYYHSYIDVTFTKIKNAKEILKCCEDDMEIRDKLIKLNKKQQEQLVELIQNSSYLKGYLTSGLEDPLCIESYELEDLIDQL